MIEMRDGAAGDIFLRFVERRNRQTLDPLINQHLRPHSTVWSDQFKAYFHLKELENVDSHLTVNHSVHFLDPETGVHTNGIEGLWGRMKLFLSKKSGIPREQIPGYIDEFWWRQALWYNSPGCFTGCSRPHFGVVSLLLTAELQLF